MCTGNIDYLSATLVLSSPYLWHIFQPKFQEILQLSPVYLANLYPSPPIQIESLSNLSNPISSRVTSGKKAIVIHRDLWMVLARLSNDINNRKFSKIFTNKKRRYSQFCTEIHSQRVWRWYDFDHSCLVSFLVASFRQTNDDDCRPWIDFLITSYTWWYRKESLSDCQSASFQSRTFFQQSWILDSAFYRQRLKCNTTLTLRYNLSSIRI